MQNKNSVRIVLLGIMFVLCSVLPGFAQIRVNYAESLIASYPKKVSAEQAEQLLSLKNEIYQTYNIIVAEDVNYAYWEKTELETIKSLLKDLPEDFVKCTSVIYREPTSLQYEIRYNGSDEPGVIYVGSEGFYFGSKYLSRYRALYEAGATSVPDSSWKQNRLKSMILRGMVYGFLRNHIDLVQTYVTSGFVTKYEKCNTKLYCFGAEENMVVDPEKTFVWVDFAFACDQFCTNSANFSSEHSEKYNFIKNNVFDGSDINGWQNTQLVTKDTENLPPPNNGGNNGGDNGGNNGGNNGGDNGGNNGGDNGGNNGGNNDDDGSIPTTDHDIPPTPTDEIYIPLIMNAETDLVLPVAEWNSMPEDMYNAIRELFLSNKLHKDFSACTKAIVYLPTKATDASMSSENYVFLTQNSWFSPSYAGLDANIRKQRLYEYLIKEMTARYVFYHGSLIPAWKTVCNDENMSNASARDGIIEATLLYCRSGLEPKNYLRTVDNEKYTFIATKVMLGKYFD